MKVKIGMVLKLTQTVNGFTTFPDIIIQSTDCLNNHILRAIGEDQNGLRSTRHHL